MSKAPPPPRTGTRAPRFSVPSGNGSSGLVRESNKRYNKKRERKEEPQTCMRIIKLLSWGRYSDS